jgi:hypothetical protein
VDNGISTERTIRLLLSQKYLPKGSSPWNRHKCRDGRNLAVGNFLMPVLQDECAEETH